MTIFRAALAEIAPVLVRQSSAQQTVLFWPLDSFPLMPLPPVTAGRQRAASAETRAEMLQAQLDELKAGKVNEKRGWWDRIRGR